MVKWDVRLSLHTVCVYTLMGIKCVSLLNVRQGNGISTCVETLHELIYSMHSHSAYILCPKAILSKCLAIKESA